MPGCGQAHLGPPETYPFYEEIMVREQKQRRKWRREASARAGTTTAPGNRTTIAQRSASARQARPVEPTESGGEASKPPTQRKKPSAAWSENKHVEKPDLSRMFPKIRGRDPHSLASFYYGSPVAIAEDGKLKVDQCYIDAVKPRAPQRLLPQTNTEFLINQGSKGYTNKHMLEDRADYLKVFNSDMCRIEPHYRRKPGMCMSFGKHSKACVTSRYSIAH
ncbi:hypothetical protein CYMTET_13410 [Cymbomonas tetramitiformis]|uniref:Uncharacterized protein n=1 Tax=Cymbomonas tetramitiformis TaxID=36881 RepID=A0AAE0GI77_9CHLO|nr:hypothetical protein CYMTET_13410 [Cymbomonas tetramitiformis]